MKVNEKKKWYSGWFSRDKISEYFFLILAAIIVWSATASKDYLAEKAKNLEWAPTTLQEDAKNFSKIQEIVKDIRAEVKADRVIVYVFHNGSVMANSIPFKKASAMYEATSYGVRPVSGEYQSVPLSQIPEILQEISFKDKSFFIKTSDLIPSNWRYSLVNDGIQSSYYRRLVDGTKIVGYVQVSFAREVDEKDVPVLFLDDQVNFINYQLNKRGVR